VKRERAVTFEAAWASPTRRVLALPPALSAHSTYPVAAVGTEARMPSPINRRAAPSDSRPPKLSRRTALVHEPIGRSVIRGWRA
jgi:hypothetical protein